MATNPDQGAHQTGESSAANENFVDMLMMMGIDRQMAIQAVEASGNVSTEAAVQWVFDNADMEAAALIDDEPTDNVKMVFAVNTSLKMGVGKVAAQVGHACIGLHRILFREQEQYGEQLLQWESYGETKIVLNGESKEKLEELHTKAESMGLPDYLVQDAGRTQIAAGSSTVLAVFGASSKVDQVTGKLKLL